MVKLNVKKQMIFSLLALSLVGCSAMTGRETAGEYLDDTSITADVKAAIFAEPSLHANQIHVETFKNDVQLSGFVDTHQQVRKAGEIARRTEGVRTVKNDIKVRRKN